ncbi:putative inactive purple acid phosphatase 16 isoform X1 [Curcuma longa]|uniref:putative inactive purple acid phosphatase 16 isoform X1 n=1 Tax=Curcuma longa TaxID=136217 RepID=UPI003D9F5B67
MDRAHCVALVLLVLLFVCVVVVITLVVLSSRRQDPFDPLPNTKPLRFSADGSPFKIALFADLHYGENAWTDWGPAQDDNSDRVMSAVIDAEDPDFVIYLGDVITANNLPIPNASLYWDRALSLTRNKWKPWSTVLGNHDDALFEWPSEWFSATGIPQVNCPKTNVPFSGDTDCSFKGTTRIELISTEINNNVLSHTTSGPKTLWPSVSNYVLRVSSCNDTMPPVVFFYFLDSGGGSYPEVVSKAQAKWFKRQSKRINPNASIPEVIFWHIPSRAYQKVAPVTTMQIHAPCVGSINKEKVAPQKAEWGIMDILVSRASVKAVFAGHNHGLDWCCPHKSLWLCFARHTGYGGYGNWSRGSRIISIVEQPFSITSWIRMEDGTEHSRVVLAP